MRSLVASNPEVVLAFALAVATVACGGDLPRPHYVAQTTEALVLVGYPAPPARVEFIPARPHGDVVWLDGEWSWTGSKWAWSKGRWVIPPSGASFSPWTTVRDDRGGVYFAEGVWKDAAGKAIPPPAPIATGRDSAGDVLSPEGDSEKTGPPLRTPGAAQETRAHP